MAVRVGTKPNQQVTVSWAFQCPHDLRVYAADFAFGRTPMLRLIKMPGSHLPKGCSPTVTVMANLGSFGHVSFDQVRVQVLRQ